MTSYIGDIGILFSIVVVIMYLLWDDLFPN
ncbi:MAG: hypothetical protein H6Q74_1516 [Firmicutes bacterium]|nr:hypothetical protein [Bacillota bacterium]